MACACGKPDQGYGAVGYLDDYGVNAEGYGAIVMTAGLLASIIGGSATVLGAGAGLLGGRQARIRQEDLIEAQRIAQEKALMLERQKMAQSQKNLFWLGILGVGGFTAFLVSKKKKKKKR
tara:strand:- start:563 stop:922 length:360 start_codon:yes stop_codon:yes gene_type:complete